MTEPIRIDALNPAVDVDPGYEMAAMLGGETFSLSAQLLYQITHNLLVSNGDLAASKLSYDNNLSGLAATTLQDAVDEIVTALGGLSTAQADYLKKDGSNVAAVVTLLQNIGLDFLIGAPIPYAGSVLPALCIWPYGQNLSRTTYAGLFDKFGTTYGPGDGTTTFGVPDLRGRVIAGKDNMGGLAANRLTSGGAGIDGTVLGASGGAQTHTLVVGEMPSHSHSLPGQYPRSTIRQNGAGGDFEASLYDQGTATGSQGGGGAHNNVQPTLVCNYVIFAGV